MCKNKMIRMRSIRETAEFFKEMDPDTQLTEKTIRTMIAQGSIPVFNTGKKFLINLDVLLEMFSTPINKNSLICKGTDLENIMNDEN